MRLMETMVGWRRWRDGDETVGWRRDHGMEKGHVCCWQRMVTS